MCAANTGAAVNTNTDSLFRRNWLWQTDTGKSLHLSELAGRPTVMALFFTTCSGTCGVTVDHMLQLCASLTAEQRKRTRFVLVTFDSENDTPHALAQYRAQRQLPADWILLHGTPASTRELATQLAVRFAPDAARHILHEAQITLLNRQGQIARCASGVNADLNPILRQIKSELAGPGAKTAMPMSP